MNQSPSKPKVPKDPTEPAKAPTPLPIDPEEGADDPISPKSYTRGEAFPKTPHDVSRNTAQPIEIINEAEPKISTPKRSGRARRPKTFYQPGLNYVNYMVAGEPRSYDEVIDVSDSVTWLQAMKSEMDSIHQNQTWELVKLPAGRKSFPCKWVF